MMDITQVFGQARPRGKGINQRRNEWELYAGSSWSPVAQKLTFVIIHEPFRSKALMILKRGLTYRKAGVGR
jgi:hypothetical protein